jgi:two-component system, sensor histidine kinase LadS
MGRCRLVLSLWVICAIWLPMQTLAAVAIIAGQNSIELSSAVQVLRGAPEKLDIEDIQEKSWQSQFVRQPSSGKAINLGLVSDVVWLRIEIDVGERSIRDWILDVPYGGFHQIEWFVPRSDDLGYGLANDLNPRLANYRYDAQPITLRSGLQVLYGRVHGHGNLTLPLQLQTESVFLKQESNHLVLQALYFGGLAALLLYALLFGWSVRDRNYLIFSAFLLSSAVAIFVGNGLARLYLWSPQTVFEPAVQGAGFGFAGAFSLWLTQTFLRSLSIRSPLVRLLGWFFWAYLIFVAFIILRLWLTFDTIFLETVFSVLTLISALLVMTVLWHARSFGHSQIYFMAAWAVVWFGALAAALRSLDLIASNDLTLYAIQISIGASSLLFSVALFVRVRQQYIERLTAQQEVLQGRQVLIQTLQDSERKLEAKVDERTAELQSSLEVEKRLREQYVRFGAMISHEFRNPLGVIETQTSLLQRELKAGIDNSDKRIGTVRSAAQRLALLFDKWLQSDRLQNATNRLQTQPIDFDCWLEDLIGKCHAYHANHQIDCQIEGTIGYVQADERLLQIAILNLIDNACKYSPVQTKVRVSAMKINQQLQITVTDQGQGISPENLDKVFDEYFRVDQNSPVLGVGLGLPFVRKIVTLHGGSVTASNNPADRGTRFTIVLPLSSQT